MKTRRQAAKEAKYADGVIKENTQAAILAAGRPTDNVPHTVEIEHVQATELAAGVQLQTKDGSLMGNAIIMKRITNEKDMAPSTPDYLELTDQRLWLVQTDFGNIMRVTDNEISVLFNLGWVSDYDRWFDARLELIRQAVEKYG